MGQASTKKYQDYRDSGEGWIGEIPSHWALQKLKHLFAEKKHRANMSLGCGAISFGEVVAKDDEKVTEATKASYQEVLAGEFLINPLNLNYDLKSLRIALSEINVVVSAGYIVLRDKGDIDRRYFKYLLHRYDVAYLKLLGSGVRQTISFTHIANSLLALPPMEEQRAITRFLDEKTSTIDAAIALEERQIALLKERKQIVIQNAVTKGLNPNAPMKDSGVDWIGEIPAHWSILQLSRFSNVIDPNPSHRNPKYVPEGFPFISTQEFIEFDEIEINTPRRVSESTVLEQEARCQFQKGSIVFSRKGTIGAVRMLPKNVRLGILDSLCVINVSKKMDASFLLRSLQADYLSQQFGPIVRGAALPQMSVGAVRTLKVVVPPMIEQAEIAQHLAVATKFIDDGIKLKRRQIALFQEYKATLVNSAVTGKIKVA